MNLEPFYVITAIGALLIVAVAYLVLSAFTAGVKAINDKANEKEMKKKEEEKKRRMAA